jgi:hypothetical protein
VHYLGKGYTALPGAVTLAAKILARSTRVEQRPLATCSDGRGLALAMGGHTLRLHKGGLGWIDSGVTFPPGVWTACAISYQQCDGLIRFYLYNYATGVFSRSSVVEMSPVLDGDGVATLNSRAGRAGFVGALTAPGLTPVVWGEEDFIQYINMPRA